ncbi:MAG TPA: GreA/GreB family elongation factor [Nocardioides sp.]|uniref:GreA/GreB family elongation factor n=1 Tax=Nocardioides sp. TaxID=35761 RepID=UPI002E2FB16B|nr:GreA/GreB family elongation factor [Nocardioides sp.]HEX5087594.1 GreA/GreB family elongation factor [Nocardioides sp.]
MTVPVNTDSLTLLSSRLDELRAERAVVLADALIPPTGDLADRATNVEASIRLQLLDERIAALELEVDERRHRPHTEGVVSVGDVVTLDLGDGDETYLVGPVEQALAGVDTVTPSSPLGRAIVGARVGETVSYEPRPGMTMTATIRSAGQLVAAG